MERMKASAWGILILIICFSVQVGGVFLYAIGVTVGVIMDPQNHRLTGEEVGQSIAYHMTVQEDIIGIGLMTSLIIAMGFGLWYYIQFARKRNRNAFKKISLRRTVSAFGMVISMQLLIGGLLNIMYALWPDGMESYSKLMSTLNVKGSIPTIIYVSLVAPVAEELVFRGVIFHLARKRTDFLFANLIQSILFGVYHLNVIQGLYAFVLGLFFGLATEKGKGILYPIWMHMLFNAASCILAILAPVEIMVPFPFLLIAMLAAIPVLALSVKGFIKEADLSKGLLLKED